MDGQSLLSKISLKNVNWIIIKPLIMTFFDTRYFLKLSLFLLTLMQVYPSTTRKCFDWIKHLSKKKKMFSSYMCVNLIQKWGNANNWISQWLRYLYSGSPARCLVQNWISFWRNDNPTAKHPSNRFSWETDFTVWCWSFKFLDIRL